MGTQHKAEQGPEQMKLVTPKGARVDSLRYPDIADLMSRLRFAPGNGRIWLDDQRMVAARAIAWHAAARTDRQTWH